MSVAFHTQTQQLNACKVFARTLPQWCNDNKSGVSFSFVSHGDGVEINLGLEDGATMEMAEDIVYRLQATERLMMIEVLVQEFRRVGAPVEEINALVDEGEQIAKMLHPQ